MERIYDNPLASERRKDFAQEIGERYEQNILDYNRRQWEDATRRTTRGDRTGIADAERIMNLQYTRDAYRDGMPYQKAINANITG